MSLCVPALADQTVEVKGDAGGERSPTYSAEGPSGIRTVRDTKFSAEESADLLGFHVALG